MIGFGCPSAMHSISSLARFFTGTGPVCPLYDTIFGGCFPEKGGLSLDYFLVITFSANSENLPEVQFGWWFIDRGTDTL